jgi:monoamine oxidase
VISACSPKDPGPEIVYNGTVAIIGAGAAGLYAADILHTKGIKVVIFEARDQMGGRVRSLRNQSIEKYPMMQEMSSDFPVELGAQTIIGSDSIFGKVFQAYSLPTLEYPPSANHFVLENVPKSESDWAGDADFAAAKSFRANLRNNVGNTSSVQQVIQASGINARAFGMLNGQIGNAYGSTNENIGIGELAEEEKLRLTDGKIIGLKTNPMHDVLISRFSNIQTLVQLNTPITSINYSADPIVLTAKDGSTYQANKVIVTTPISVLKSGLMTFSPGLPGTFASSLARFEMGATLRVVLEFKKNFWGDTVGYILGSSNIPEYLSVGVGRSVFNASLSVTLSGNKAVEYSALGAAGMVDAILADIDLLYAGQGTLYVRSILNSLPADKKYIYVLEDWTKVSYISGGYSYPLPGATNADRKALGQPINDKLFFAGEATDVSGQAGMVNGALASAERVVIDVINAIKKV